MFFQPNSKSVFILALRFGGEESPKSAAEGGFKPKTSKSPLKIWGKDRLRGYLGGGKETLEGGALTQPLKHKTLFYIFSISHGWRTGTTLTL